MSAQTGSRGVAWPGLRGPLSVAELTRKGYARLAEKIDVARSRHKPLSLLRQEAKRVLEQFVDADGAHLSKGERDRLVEDVTASSLGFCPLEELFRDDGKQEILCLAWNQVIARSGEQWLPTSARFRDNGQYSEFVLRLADIGIPAGTGPEGVGAFDVILPNGFRAVAILPPAVMGQPPLVLLARGEPPQPPSKTAVGPQSILTTPAPVAASKSAVQPTPSARPVPADPPRTDPPRTGPPATMFMEPRPSLPPTGAPDPYARLRAKVTERLIARCASAGVYDITQIPTAELRRILTVHVAEVTAGERVRLDEAEQERMVLQILVAMNR